MSRIPGSAVRPLTISSFGRAIKASVTGPTRIVRAPKGRRMPLQLPTPPPNAHSLIVEAIGRLSTAAGAANVVTGVDNPSLLNAALPHRVYTLGGADILQLRNLDRARLVAWRFLIQYGSKTVAAVEFACDASGANLRFAKLDAGPFAQGTRDAVAQAEKLDSVKDASYEVRVLKAPSVYVIALWLKNQGTGDDIVMPINQSQAGGPATGGGPQLPQKPTEFLKALRPSARTALTFNSAPQPIGGQGPSTGRITPPPAPAPRPTPQASEGYTFNRQDFIKSYANMVARTWTDDSYLQLLLADPVDTLNQAGLQTIPGAVIRIVQHQITGTGRIEDEVSAWVAGNQTGLYDLFLPIKPDYIDFSGAGGSTDSESGGGSCCCSPCCCCT
jgi:hypothetical protein